MSALVPIAATDIGHSHSIADALPHLGGMLLVLVTLTVLWGICELTAALIRRAMPKPAAAKAATPAAAPAERPEVVAAIAGIAAAESSPRIVAAIAAIVATESSPRIIAAIAAAVAATAGPNRRIISIRSSNSAWEKAGRQAVLGSHRLR
jgi:Na+-transporting methylmalonyl-CoA/oxaloacetate decarboxylase gamma subunit